MACPRSPECTRLGRASRETRSHAAVGVQERAGSLKSTPSTFAPSSSETVPSRRQWPAACQTKFRTAFASSAISRRLSRQRCTQGAGATGPGTHTASRNSPPRTAVWQSRHAILGSPGAIPHFQNSRARAERVCTTCAHVPETPAGRLLPQSVSRPACKTCRCTRPQGGQKAQRLRRTEVRGNSVFYPRVLSRSGIRHAWVREDPGAF